MLLNVSDRVPGQVLVDLGNDARPNVGMKSASEVGQRLWRGYDDQGRHFPCSQDFLHRGGDLLCKPMLLNLVPIDRLYRDCTN